MYTSQVEVIWCVIEHTLDSGLAPVWMKSVDSAKQPSG